MSDQSSTLDPQVEDGNHVAEEDYELPETFAKILNCKIEDMLKKGIIGPSTSEWSSPVAFVLRKVNYSKPAHFSDVARIIIDYRELNKVMVPKPSSNPVTLKRLFPLIQGKCFSILDCRLPYPCHQIAIGEESRPMTAFTSPTGRWEFNFLPYGMRDSSKRFRLIISKTLLDLQGKGAVGYGDYIIISSSDVETNISMMREVMEKLKKCGLKLNLSGCVFIHQQFQILGG